MTRGRSARPLLAAVATIALTSISIAAQEPELVWEEPTVIGGAVFGLATSSAESEKPPPARGGQLLLAAGFGAFTSSYGDSWTRADRVGWVRGAVAAPGGRAMFVSGESGVWRSTNGGRSWSLSRVRDEDPAKVLAISPDWDVDGASYAVTTNDGRLYKMERDRSSWLEVIIDPGQEHWTAALAFSPVTGVDETIFAGTNAGIFKSTNNGQTWTKVSGESAPAFGPEGGSPWYQGLIVSPDYGDDPARLDDPVVPTLFAFNEHGIWRSDDDGASWTPIPLDADQLRSIAVSPGWPRDQTLMAAVSDSDGTVATVSTNGGQSWRRIAGHDGLSGTSVAMAFDYAPPFRGSPRNGIFLPILAKHAPVETGPGPGVEGSREAYLATDGDVVWRTRDEWRTWERIESGFAGVAGSSIAFLPGDQPAVLLGTSMTGLYSSADAGHTWARIEGSGVPLGEGRTIKRIEVSPTFDADGSLLAATTEGIYASTDRGRHWTLGADSPPATDVALSPAFDDDGEARAPGARTTDGGRTWQTDEGTSAALSLAYHPDYPTDPTLWMGTQSGISVSHDAGAGWTPIEDTSLEDRQIYDLEPVMIRASVDPLRIFAGSDEGIYRSEDAGVEWSRVTGVFTRDTYRIASVETSQPVGAVLLSASDSGVSWSFNRGIDWARDSSSPEPSLDVALSTDGCLYLVATERGAAWARAVVDPRCAPPPPR